MAYVPWALRKQLQANGRVRARQMRTMQAVTPNDAPRNLQHFADFESTTSANDADEYAIRDDATREQKDEMHVEVLSSNADNERPQGVRKRRLK